MKKRVLFLMSDTGGGHRASANAISEAIEHLFPEEFEPIIEDVWQNHTLWPLNQTPKLYSWLTGPGLRLWKAGWSALMHKPMRDMAFTLASPLAKRRAVAYIRAVQPDIVVSVHPLMNHLGVDWVKTADLNIPFVTVVTDMVSLHPAWICPDVTACVVPTEPARELAIQFGMAPEKVTVLGQPVGLKFAELTQDKHLLRQQLGLQTNRHTVLVVGGGEGMGRVFEIARTVAQQAPQAQLLVVAGRNDALRQRLESVRWEIPTRIFGFVDNMPELMGAADLLITKAGPGTISEAFIAGLPPILSGYIPGQETGNVDYVRYNGAGTYAEKPQEIARLVRELTAPNSLALQRMTQNAVRLARPEASLQIATHICRLA